MLAWDDLFFEEQAERVLDMFGLTEKDKGLVRGTWAEQVFEIDRVVYRNGERFVTDGRKTALAELQSICMRLIIDRSGVLDTSRDFASDRSKQ